MSGSKVHDEANQQNQSYQSNQANTTAFSDPSYAPDWMVQFGTILKDTSKLQAELNNSIGLLNAKITKFKASVARFQLEQSPIHMIDNHMRSAAHEAFQQAIRQRDAGYDERIDKLEAELNAARGIGGIITKLAADCQKKLDDLSAGGKVAEVNTDVAWKQQVEERWKKLLENDEFFVNNLDEACDDILEVQNDVEVLQTDVGELKTKVNQIEAKVGSGSSSSQVGGSDGVTLRRITALESALKGDPSAGPGLLNRLTVLEQAAQIPSSKDDTKRTAAMERKVKSLQNTIESQQAEINLQKAINVKQQAEINLQKAIDNRQQVEINSQKAIDNRQQVEINSQKAINVQQQDENKRLDEKVDALRRWVNGG